MLSTFASTIENETMISRNFTIAIRNDFRHIYEKRFVIGVRTSLRIVSSIVTVTNFHKSTHITPLADPKTPQIKANQPTN